MPRTEQRMRGGASACQRCRRRKQKCDQSYPQCSNCESVNAACLTYHSGKQADIPRDYVSNLEDQIAELTQEVRALRECTRRSSVENGTLAHFTPVSQPTHETGIVDADRQSAPIESSPLSQDSATEVRRIVVEPLQQPRFLGESSGISFAKMVTAAIHIDNLSSSLVPEQQPFHEFSVSESTPARASLPPRHVADHLVDVYFQYRTPHLPILSRSQVSKAINSAYCSLAAGQASADIPEHDMFIAYMVFAIALVDVPHTSGGRPTQSDGCFRSALNWVENILTYSKTDLETLRNVLLLAQFVALSPSRGSLWHLTGFALRLCIDQGLHWETDLQCLNVDPDVLDDRRRLWHSTYHFDRLLCITLGRPFGIPDESTRVQLPNPWTRCRQGPGRQQPCALDIHTQRAHNHLFILARLESEIKYVQQSQVWALKPAYPRPRWMAWLQDIQPRLEEWNATIPELGKAHPSSIFASQAYWEVIYNNTLLLLCRPQTGTMYQSAEELSVSFEASSKVIAGLEVLQREGRVEMLWKSVHHLFMAGLGVIYGLWQSKEIRDQNPVDKSISILQSCASTLSAMSATLIGAVGCRSAFQALSSATIDWLVTRDIQEVQQNRAEFENHVRELMKQLQLSCDGATANHDRWADNMSTVLFSDSFDLGEMLNTAAQWPDLGDFNFMTGEEGTMTGTTMTGAAIDATATDAIEQLLG